MWYEYAYRLSKIKPSVFGTSARYQICTIIKVLEYWKILFIKLIEISFKATQM